MPVNKHCKSPLKTVLNKQSKVQVRPIKVAREMAVQTPSLSNKLITRVRFFVHISWNNQRWREKAKLLS